MVCHLLTLTLMTKLILLLTGKKVPYMALILLTFSKRIHSIYMLRLFNDCIAVLFGYISILLFIKYQYRFACLFYSISVSIKMNMLLYAPGILLVLIMGTGIKETIICLSICAITQLILGYPFLSTYPIGNIIINNNINTTIITHYYYIEYLSKSFELSRVFMYKWTVNYKFLPEEIFLSKTLSIILLLLTILMIIIFAYKWINENNKNILKYGKKNIIGIGNIMAPNFIILTIFTSNFIGISFARTLHYQFYSWYFHTIPYLLWHINIPIILKLFIYGCIEISFNIYPAIPISSGLLQLCHIIILLGLLYTPAPLAIEEDNNINKKKK